MSPNEDVDSLDLEHIMSVALEVVHEAGEMIVKALDDPKEETKSRYLPESQANPDLTETGRNVTTHIVKGLASKFFRYRYITRDSISDERGRMLSRFPIEPTWIIDPIQSTMNFLHSNPLVCTSVALTVNRHVVLGIVNNPVTRSCYTAIKGKGAFLNGSKLLKTSGIEDLGQAMLFMEIATSAFEYKRRVVSNNVATFMEKAHAIRCPGPAALDIAMVAAGSGDVAFHFSTRVWEIAAAALIVTEAGGVVLDPTGEEFDMMARGIVAAATPELAKQLVEDLEVSVSTIRDYSKNCPL